MEFLGDLDGAIVMIDCLRIITSFPVNQANVANGLALFESVTQLFFNFQRTIQKIERASSITQMLVTVPDEAQCDGLTVAVSKCSISGKGLLIFRQCGG